MSRRLVFVFGAIILAAACSGATTSDTGGTSSSSGGASSSGGQGDGGSGTLDGNPSTDDGTIAGSTPLPCDVDTVLANNCRSCHARPPQFGAPMPLLTWEDTQGPSKEDASKKIYERMGARIHDDANPMPPSPNARLSAADTATIDAWVA